MTVDPDAAGDADTLALLAPGVRRASRSVRLRLGIGAAAVLLIGALVVTVVISLLAPGSGSQSVAAVTAQTRQAASAGDQNGDGNGAGNGHPTGSARPGILYVHVLGAVNNAGLYQLSSGARVVDAVAAAGGFTADANQGGVNLARALSDGEQLVVPRVGEPASEAVPDGAAPGVGDGRSTGSGGAVGGKVNLNTAGEAELQTLPHVGPALAARILQWRKDNGRFSTVDDLTAVSGIGAKTFEALKDLVTV
ncbi:ComEA family DNA-binding protein [Rathayibacter soli]|uniref:ComEA family DNA-binding protein n=1 Tax=Rathayibacter soli TaxID=3144168 RepID=UPI0027E43F4F|nr:helix-hairpin-helix domain-containing protein [Glaciibacter superstes]